METKPITVKEIRDFILDAYGKSNNDKDMLTMLLENLDDNFHDAELPSEEDVKTASEIYLSKNIFMSGANYVINYIKSKTK